MLHAGLFLGLVGTAAALALWRGDGRERVGGPLLAAAGIGAVWLGAGPMLGLEVILIGALGRIAWRAPRTWPVWALACHAVAAAATLAFLLQPDVAAETWRGALMLTHGGAAVALILGLRRRVIGLHS